MRISTQNETIDEAKERETQNQVLHQILEKLHKSSSPEKKPDETKFKEIKGVLV